MSILALLPGGDVAANTAAQWGVDALTSRGVVHSALTGLAVDLNAITAGAPTATYVLYFGHGENHAWVANPNANFIFLRRILESNQVAILKNLSVVAIACHCASGLGVAAKNAGANLFVGFSDTVSWQPHVPETILAVGNCVDALVGLALNGVTNRVSYQTAVAKHRRYWEDQRDRGRLNAQDAVASLLHLEQYLQVL